jgi:esterase/lipase
MKLLSTIAFSLLISVTGQAFATEERSFSCWQREVLPTPDGDTIPYYTSLPKGKEFEGKAFPLILQVDGSYVHHEKPGSVRRFTSTLGFNQVGFGVICMERRGVDGEEVDIDKYHEYNTPSQRIHDHRTLVEHLRKNKSRLKNWDGRIFVLGTSEGAPIAIKLADHLTLDACVAVVAGGDISFQDFIWQHIQAYFHNDSRTSLRNFSQEFLGFNLTHYCNDWVVKKLMYFICWYQNIPTTEKEYETICAMIRQNPTSKVFWYGQTHKYWDDALGQTEKDEFLRLRCPILVVYGSKDVHCESTERLIKLARNDQEVTALRLEGSGHNISDPRHIDEFRSVLSEFLLKLKDT